MERRMEKLESALQRVANNALSPELAEETQVQEEPSPVRTEIPQEILPGTGCQQSTNHLELIMDLDSGPGAMPGFSIRQTLPAACENIPIDLISRDIISVEDARIYFTVYRDRLDHFLYRILGDRSTSEDIRWSSPLLTTAICAVGSLHSTTGTFDLCYKEFVSLSATQTFFRKSTIDDLRALLIGAFWLGDLSWKLVGIAVRIATELQLHKSFPHALRGDREHYLRTRLFFLVYICDHHFSVPFGRPPMTRECDAVRNVRQFLQCKHATEDDARVVSQVLRWSLCSNIQDTFGVDVDKPLSDVEVVSTRRFNDTLDSLRAEWAGKFRRNDHVGNYPRQGVILQTHFAKLYLCSHALRGAGSDQLTSRIRPIALELEYLANRAVESAQSILQTVVTDTEVQSHLNGLPIYFDTMVAFAVVFLLKVSTKYSALVQVDIREIQRLITCLVVTLKRITATLHPRHLLVSIARGIDSLVQRCGLPVDPRPLHSGDMPQLETETNLPHSTLMEADLNWMTTGDFDPYFMGDYDFLLDQDLETSLDAQLSTGRG